MNTHRSPDHLGVVQIVITDIRHHFHKRTQRTLGGRAVVRVFKMSFVGHCDFEKGSRNSQCACLVGTGQGGGHKKLLQGTCRLFRGRN